MADFRNAQFGSTAIFSSAEFDSIADFSRSNFGSIANFHGAEFNSTADFHSAEFKSDLYFLSAKLKSYVSFDSCIFGGNVNFIRTVMPDTLDFRFITDINSPIDFSYSLRPISGEKCQIALFGSDIQKIKLNMRNFSLFFHADTIFDTTIATKARPVGRFHDVWFYSDTIISIDSIITPSPDEKMSVYESVLKKFRDDGLMDSYEILDIDYHEFRYSNDNWFRKYIVGNLDRLWWHYGYSKERALYIAFILWLVFSLFNKWKYHKITGQVYSIPKLTNLRSHSTKEVGKWFFYYLVALIYTAIIFFGLKMNIENIAPNALRHKWLFAYLMFVYVSGLVCLGFIANIIFG